MCLFYSFGKNYERKHKNSLSIRFMKMLRIQPSQFLCESCHLSKKLGWLKFKYKTVDATSDLRPYYIINMYISIKLDWNTLYRVTYLNGTWILLQRLKREMIPLSTGVNSNLILGWHFKILQHQNLNLVSKWHLIIEPYVFFLNLELVIVSGILNSFSFSN